MIRDTKAIVEHHSFWAISEAKLVTSNSGDVSITTMLLGDLLRQIPTLSLLPEENILRPRPHYSRDHTVFSPLMLTYEKSIIVLETS